jgi:hypothetical protein
MDEKVDDYIKKQLSPQKEICQILRNIILKTYPNIKEEMKWGVPNYGNLYYYVALKEYVNLGFSIKNLSNDEIKLLEGTGKTMRHIKIRSIDDIDGQKIVKLLKMVMNRR